MFDYFKKAAISNRANDELLYEFVLNEMDSGVLIKGLWGKALANSEGNDANAKSIYMKYRVQAIKDIFTSREIAYNELTKPKLFQYIQDKILPMSNDYVTLKSKPVEIETRNYQVSKHEEALYDEVANELSNNIRKEGLWLKAIQNTDGNESKALALYIRYRSEAIRVEKEEAYEKELKIKEAKQQKVLDEQRKEESRQQKILEENRKEEKKKKWINTRMNLSSNEKFALLTEFIEKMRMRITSRVSDNKAIAYAPDNVDKYVEFIDGNWQITKVVNSDK